eukprot:TRINITY_DN6183_c0_g1_i4.p5 TRINITY_DN6183_c0_g1~~TRINITY_DN6183_c0_g1_i4.p5  ORF type:complete len:135 (+),score=2.02 TRINITY_DN6183_c0_g1_i4:436-840(+)
MGSFWFTFQEIGFIVNWVYLNTMAFFFDPTKQSSQTGNPKLYILSLQDDIVSGFENGLQNQNCFQLFHLFKGCKNNNQQCTIKIKRTQKPVHRTVKKTLNINFSNQIPQYGASNNRALPDATGLNQRCQKMHTF